ncbi:MAG: ABC-2 transporter permease [Oscillospiraceae bacterium]|nr:ABC-2 transporter permease [Oscillospiraceae bacterium]
MKGLLLKDLYMIKSYCKAYLFLIPVFWIISFLSGTVSFMTFYSCLLTAMIPVSLQVYDEKEHWSCYSCTLPYSPRQIVSAKYLLNLMTTLLNLVAVLICQSIRMMHFSGFDLQELLLLCIPSLFISLLPPMFVLPFIFRFGAEKAQLAYLLTALVIGIASAVIVMTNEIEFSRMMWEIQKNPIFFETIALAGILILYRISWKISIKIYARKEFT